MFRSRPAALLALSLLLAVSVAVAVYLVVTMITPERF